jgi:hypothetical protein
MKLRRHKLIFGTVMALLGLASLPTATADETASEGLPLWELGIGAAAYHQPSYPGSDVRSTTGFPFPYVIYRGDWFRIDRSLQGIIYDIRRLADLQGSKIGIGPERSGTAFLAKRLLGTADLGSLEIVSSHHPLRQQIELTAGGELDLALFVIDENADLIREAVRPGSWSANLFRFQDRYPLGSGAHRSEHKPIPSFPRSEVAEQQFLPCRIMQTLEESIVDCLTKRASGRKGDTVVLAFEAHRQDAEPVIEPSMYLVAQNGRVVNHSIHCTPCQGIQGIL